MSLLVALLVTVSVSLFVFGLGALLTTGGSEAVRSRLVDQRLVRREGRAVPPEQREQIEEIFRKVGRRIVKEDEGGDERRLELQRAGFRGQGAVAIYYGARIAGFVGFGVGVGLLAIFLGSSFATIVLAAGGMAVVGWYVPWYYVRVRKRRRQREIQKALADALDLLVVCVEVGLGLNQAFQRVAREIREVSEPLADEFEQVNLEIRAGSPREEALRSLGRRTDLDDVRALVAMLIQTDRFGTSIGKALRVHADGLRTKRRQRAEEQAAKTTIKIIFPLVLFIMPALFVVILAPAAIHIFALLGS